MAFLKGLKALFSGGGSEKKAKKDIGKYIRTNTDPTELWENIGELGDGAFGKVYKVRTVH